jgi:hypothetical protein
VTVEKIGAQIDGTWRVEHAAHRFDKHGYRVRFKAVRIAEAKPPKPPKPEPAAKQLEPPRRDVHLVVVEVKAIGDTPLPNHPVRLFDAATGEPASKILHTDSQGILRVQVESPGKFRVEIVDREVEDHHGPEEGGNDEPAALVCRFVGTGGGPVAGEEVEVRIGDDVFTVTTDEDGLIDAPATFAAYELTLRGEKFVAHAVASREKDRAAHVFVVGEQKHDRHVIATVVKGIGDTPLVRHRVRVVDPETGEPVTEWLETDDGGVLRTEVPEERAWRIEIEDRPAADDEDGPEIDPGREGGIVVCVFTDRSGAPLAGERVEAGEVALLTDEGGRLEAAASLGPCELKVRGKTFLAHALPASDAEKEENVYRFVVEEE